VPNDARMYDYALGGKDNYLVDREASEAVREALPTSLAAVQENRRFMRRAVRHLLAAGVRQFLDIGCGLPGEGNVHDLAHAVDPSATVVYVDNDPVIVNHYQALLSSSEVATALLGDVRRPGEILTAPATTKLIDFDRPVGILMIALLSYLSEEEDPASLVKTIVSAVAPGSYLVLSHYNPDALSAEERATAAELATAFGITLTGRSAEEIEGFFGDLVLVEPGMVQPPLWRPDRPQREPTGWLLVGVGRKA
jgi:O-methyltransferase involved in polyketide biosynthesis